MGRFPRLLVLWIAAVFVAGVWSIPSARPERATQVALGGSLDLGDPAIPELTTTSTTASSPELETTSDPDASEPTTTTTAPLLTLPDVPDLPLPPDGGVVVPPSVPQPKTAYGDVWSIDHPPPMPPEGMTDLQNRRPPVPLSGTVVDEVGLPVANTCVRVTSTAWFSKGDGSPEDRGPGPYTTRTDAIGQYHLDVIPWQYRVDAIDCRTHTVGAGHAPGWRWISLWGYERGIVDVPVTPGAALHVKLVAPDGTPIADRCISVISYKVVSLVGAMGQVYTGSTGELTISGLPDGTARVVASGDCDWASSTDGSSQEFIDLVVNETTELELHPMA